MRYLDTLNRRRKEKKKEIREEKEINHGLIKDRIITDNRTLFEQKKEKDYYKKRKY